MTAGKQSCGTLIALPGEAANSKERARVVGIKTLSEVPAPSLSNANAAQGGARVVPPRVRHRQLRKLNIGPNLPNLYAAISGNSCPLAPAEMDEAMPLAIDARRQLGARLHRIIG